MRQGHALGEAPVDCGAMCLPGLAERVGELVDDAVAAGAQVPAAITACACAQGLCFFGQATAPFLSLTASAPGGVTVRSGIKWKCQPSIAPDRIHKHGGLLVPMRF